MSIRVPFDICTRSYFLSPSTFVSSVSNALSRLSIYMESQHGHEEGCHEAANVIQGCARRMDALVTLTTVETAVAFIYHTVACAAKNHNSWKTVEYLEYVKANINYILDPSHAAETHGVLPRLPTYTHYHHSALGPSGLTSYLPNATTLMELAFTDISQDPSKQVFNAPGQVLINLLKFRTAPELARGHIPEPLRPILDMYASKLIALFQRWKDREDAQRAWWSRWCPDGEEYRYWVLLAHLISPLYYDPNADLLQLPRLFVQLDYHCSQLEARLTEAAFDIDAATVLEQLEL